MNVPQWLEPVLRVGLWLCRPKYLVGVFPVCIDADERVLLIKKRLGAATGWQLPGGAKEYGVSLEASACRELYEETGLEAMEKDLRFIDIQILERYRDVQVSYLVTRWKGVASPRDTTEIEAAQWVPIRKALSILYVPHQPILESALRQWYRCGLAMP